MECCEYGTRATMANKKCFMRLTPGCVEHDQAELLVLDELGEVVGGQWHDGARGRDPVGVVEGHHVVDDILGAPLSGVVLMSRFKKNFFVRH